MNSQEKIWYLIARSLNGEASSREREELQSLLHQDESLQQQFDILTRIWKDKGPFVPGNENEEARLTISRIISRAEHSIADTNTRLPWINRNKSWIWAAAGLFLLATTIAWWLLNRSDESKHVAKQESLEAKKGSRSKSLLPDGTTVWLNAGSKLYHTGNFKGETREVTLEGEAFFDVTEDEKRPFIVHAANVDIKVLGTAFNVKSYPEDQTIETTLYRGSVQVSRENEPEKIVELKPNEKLIIARQAATDPDNLSENITPSTNQEMPASFTLARIDSTKKESERIETAWVYSRLEFRGDDFEELARKLERWYNVTINFSDERVKQLSFDGSFEKENIEQAIMALQIANSFTYSINDREISIGSSK